MTPPQDNPLLKILGRTWFAWLWWTAPQLLLLFLNLSDYALVADELSAEEQGYWNAIFSVSGVFLGLGLLIPLLLRSRRGQLLWFIICILLPAGFIFYGTFAVEKAIPSSVDWWILHPGNLVFNLWACQVLASLYGFSRLCGRIAESGGFSTLFLGIAATVVPVGVLWLALQLFSDFLVGTDYLFTLVATTVAVVTVILAFGVFLIAISLLRVIFREQDSYKGISLTLLIALALPLAGLALNRSIPFPQDYQNPIVYFLVILNAMILSIPGAKSDRGRRLQLFVSATSLPFSLYFFAAFLPFYPLSALAMIAVGSGFLILTPLLLSVVHVGKIALLARSLDGTAKKIFLIFAGAVILPAFILIGMIKDRSAILEAVDYAISPDPTALDQPPEAWRVARVVKAVTQQSRGIQYPILSPLYRTIVLQGMSLPNSTIEELENTFGFESPNVTGGFSGFWSIRERGPNLDRHFRSPPALADLQSLKFAPNNEGGIILTGEVVNTSPDPRTEFRGNFSLPPGVWVSGAELLIGDQWKPADIRERRSAEWIYRMITSERRRDPLLITLDKLHEVKVQVFPVDQNEPRRFRIHLKSVYPQMPSITFQEFSWSPEESPEFSPIIDVGGNLLVSRNAKLPTHTLEPEYHLILDRSIDAPNREELKKMLGSTLQQIPKGAPLRWWLIHDGVRLLENFPSVNSTTLFDTIDWSAIPETKSGGHNEGHLLLAILHQWRESLRGGIVPENYPALIPVGRQIDPTELPKVLEFINPQMGSAFAWMTSENPPIPSPDQSVSIIRKGGSIGIVPEQTGGDGSRWAFLFQADGAPDVLDEDRQFRPISHSILTSPVSNTEAIRILLRDSYSRYNPALHEAERTSLISQSKEFAILLPETALIVLETSAQEEFLKRLEETGTEAHSGFSFSETPEPTTLIVIGFLLWAFIRRDR